MNEDYKEVFDDVRAWQAIHENPGAQVPVADPYWKDFFRYIGTATLRAYDILQTGIDPFIDSLKTFFQNVYLWLTQKWGQLSAWLAGISGYIEDLWNNLKDYFQGLCNRILNFPIDLWAWVRFAWDQILDYVWLLGSNIWKWVKEAWEEILDYAWKLVRAGLDWLGWFWAEIYEYVKDLALAIWDPAWGKVAEWYEKVEAWVLAGWGWLKAYILEYWERVKAWVLEKWAEFKAWIFEGIPTYWPKVKEALEDILRAIWAYILKSITYLKDRYAAPLAEGIQRALGWIEERFTYVIGRAYDEIMDLAGRYRPMTPERSVELAGLMFGSAVGLGALAHGIALSVEAIPNLKYMGVHYLSAFAARMGGFGAISGATMGVIAAISLRTPFTYYLNSLIRPTIPDARMLIEFRAKREINLPEFKSYMKYHGYSDRWIELTDSWLWKDPRLFEILYLTDVTVPTEDWLKRKFERAGYEDVDVKYMVRTAQMRTTKSPRTYVMTALRRNYRHGFLTEHELTEGIEALEVAPDAIDWIKRAGELDNIYEINTDLVTAYRTAYRNDLITEEECAASLSALGLPPARVDAVVYLEWVRKTPSALRAERKEVEAQWREVQKKYSQVYIECFRRGLITEEQLAGYLIAIGIHEKVATMTARQEAIKLLPKTKPEPMPELIIPPPVTPPEYEE